MNRAAKRYAKAILQQANEANVANQVFDDMKNIYATIMESPQLQDVLNSPIIKASDKKGALLTIFKEQSETTKSLIKLLTENQRTNLLKSVAKNYINLYNTSQGVIEAQVVSAVGLSSELEEKVLQKIKELTGSNKVSINNIIDSSIIGGFILKIGDLQYDASIANKLSNIKKEFSKSL